MSHGLRIAVMPTRPDPALIADFRAMVTPHISDSMERLHGAGPLLRPMYDLAAGGTMCGPAFTVRVPPGDNLLVHKALDTAQPGDVIVVDAGGICEQAIIGDLMSTHANTRRLGGMVIFGAIRDSAELAGRPFPVFACGVSHRGPYKNGPGEINGPVSIGGMVVNAGDIIVGDADGVVAIPRADAQKVLTGARAKKAAEDRQMQAFLAGNPDRSWVDAALKKLGYPVG